MQNCHKSFNLRACSYTVLVRSRGKIKEIFFSSTVVTLVTLVHVVKKFPKKNDYELRCIKYRWNTQIQAEYGLCPENKCFNFIKLKYNITPLVYTSLVVKYNIFYHAYLNFVSRLIHYKATVDSCSSLTMNCHIGYLVNGQLVRQPASSPWKI